MYRLNTSAQTNPHLGKLNKIGLALLVVELIIILTASLFATSPYLDFSTGTRLGGMEAEYLTRTAYSIPLFLKEKGYIPLWDPFMEKGDPTFTNPVSYAMNPFLVWPGWIWGPENGIKLSVLLTAFIAGLGGWVLGRVLGFGLLGRLTLAVLCIGKGNMHAFLAEGHFALFATQAYFPWIFAGVMGILRGYRRWPIILTALAFSLVFWTGIPWYPPAILIAIAFLTVFYIVGLAPYTGEDKFPRLVVEWGKLRQVVCALLLTACLAAITVFPLWEKRDFIGNSSIVTDFRVDLGVIVDQYFSGVKAIENTGKLPDGLGFVYYSFISPTWYVVLITVSLVTLSLLSRVQLALAWRLFGAACLIIVFCSLWGAGQNPVIDWAYQNIPLANQFRHVGRVLALSSLWLAVLIALGADTLWRYLVTTPVWLNNFRLPRPAKRVLPLAVGLMMLLPSGVASHDVLAKWHEGWFDYLVRSEDPWENYCVTWLRSQYPDKELSVWIMDYKNIYTYYRNRVRAAWIASDFYHAKPIAPTVFQPTLLLDRYGKPQNVPEYALGFPQQSDDFLRERGYEPMPESANPYWDNQPCMYHKADAFSYTFSITRDVLVSYDEVSDVFPASFTTPIESFVRDYDRIAIVAQARSDTEIVVAAREVAYPGWQVFVDGQPATLESVGGLIGVILPPDDAQHLVYFQFLPRRFFIGAVITLVTAVGCSLYLLGVDRFIHFAWCYYKMRRNQFG